VLRLALLLPILAQAPVVSGPGEGKRPGPYSFVLCTGDNRGKSHCYICETENRPAVIVFARGTDEPLGKLAAEIDKALGTYKKNDLRAWVTLLAEEQDKIDAGVLAWAKKHAVRSTPVGVFEDIDGPPSYKLARDAEVTVLLSVKQKVVVNRAFRKGELNDERIAEIVKALPRIAGDPKK
jgi:hypothetical protein